ncbi:MULTISPECIES: DUF6875 domain-containing protein [unclassified Amycolatopsis]|uniref:DUF6875 domain-containing protein n=1 Tax=unclassified Amycolatopsis TaxID=2618356 RepID=UPI002876696B|nr:MULTISPECIES: hypothetical protein [unclassified Amycolatopsis]MDS0139425.1 hypothetical protein [Amycolatopsis sp. 505]MDS0147004.1 hypothetical protein [Amycolatopsis sp. CM201R]
MIGDDKVGIWTAAEVSTGAVPAEHLPPLREILAWAWRYLVSAHPDLGRNGPVCPYTQPSLHKGLFHLAALTAPSGDVDAHAAIESLRAWYERLSAGFPPEHRELLTILLVLPQLDHHDATPLDDLQREAKDGFVADGLMIGQFHPVCDQPGLWNDEFKALRAPVPLLAVRKLVVFDLPFLMDSPAHAESYFRRFAPDIPPRIRDQLVKRLVGTTKSLQTA